MQGGKKKKKRTRKEIKWQTFTKTQHILHKEVSAVHIILATQKTHHLQIAELKISFLDIVLIF